MSTTIRPETSKRGKYWLEKHRHYELKHFCLQYPIWKQAYAALDSLDKRSGDLIKVSKNGDIHDPTAKCAEARLRYSEWISMIEATAKEADYELWEYILKGVTEELSYDYLKSKFDIPCSKDTYYDRYRRFFWLLNKARG